MADRTVKRTSSLGRMAISGTVLAYVGLVLLAPMLALVVEGFTDATDASLGGIDIDTIAGAFGRSILLATIAATVNGILGIGAGFVVARHRFALRGVLDTLVDLPLAISPVMIGLGFLTIFGRDGWLEPVAERLGIPILFAFPGMAIATLFVTLPYTVREVVYVLEELGTSEEQAARSLGASPIRTFFAVTLPNLRHAVAYGVVMTVARALGEFGAVLVLGGSVAGATQTATTLVHDALEERLELSAYVVAGLLSLVSIALLFLLEWVGKKRDQEKQRWTSAQSV